MAVYSMTGYANAASEAADSAAAVTVEARSVNGRFLDLALRLPDELRGLEPALRELLTATFRRGKIELRVATSRESEGTLAMPTSEQLNRLSHHQSAIQGWLPQARELSVNEILHWCKGGAPTVKLDEPALDAARRWNQSSGYPVYLGEFGTIEHVDMTSRANYARAVREEAEKRGIGWTYWELASPSFGMYSPKTGTWHEPIRKALLE